MNRLEESLQIHADICDAVHQVILDENRHLKSAGRLPDEDFLGRKRAALANLTGSLTMLREVNEQAKATAPGLRALVEKVQQIIMRALLVDRENEQLLLKCSMRQNLAVPAPLRPTMNHLQRAYGAGR